MHGTAVAAPPIRVVVADDGAYLRRLIVEDLRASGIDVVSEAWDLSSAIDQVRATEPDVAMFDVRMPPNNSHEGLEAVRILRAEGCTAGMILLTAQPDLSTAAELLDSFERGVGYLLKDSIGTTGREMVNAITRVHSGEIAIDPALCHQLLTRQRRSRLIDDLSPTQYEVLARVAEGLSNRGIAESLHLSERTVESHIRAIFDRLRLPNTGDLHRRVLAAVEFLRQLD